MNAYRIALILCRAVALDLWWSVAVGLVSSGLVELIVRLGWLSSPAATSQLYYGLGGVVPRIIVAIFVGQFAPALATAAVGRGSLEGDAIAARTILEPHERALASIGAGLTMLFSGLSSALFVTVWGAYGAFSSSSVSIGRSMMIFNAISSLLPSFLYCAVGFVLAFQLGLRRVMQSEES